MREVRNNQGKLVCRIDERTGLVEIVHKGCITLINFKPDGTVEILNSEPAA